MIHELVTALLAAAPAGATGPPEIYTCHYRNATVQQAVCIGTDRGQPVQFAVNAVLRDTPNRRPGRHQVLWTDGRIYGYAPCGQAIAMLRPHLEAAVKAMELAVAKGRLPGQAVTNAAAVLTTAEAGWLVWSCWRDRPDLGVRLGDAGTAVRAARDASAPGRLVQPLRALRVALGYPPDFNLTDVRRELDTHGARRS